MIKNTMKNTVLIISLLALVLASCSKLERNEKKFYKGMQDEDYEVSIQAFNEFTDWMQRDRSTMTYDFKLMREKMGLKIATSEDGKLRCYSWPTNVNDTIQVYANIIQWVAGENFVGFNGPIDKLLAGRNANIKKESTMAHSIDTIFELKATNPTVYLIMQSYRNMYGRNRAYVSAAFVDGVVLRLLPFFFDGTEIAGNYEFNGAAKPSIDDLFKWDEKTLQFKAYQTDDNYNIIPGKYAVYQLDKHRFVRLPEQDQPTINN